MVYRCERNSHNKEIRALLMHWSMLEALSAQMALLQLAFNVSGAYTASRALVFNPQHRRKNGDPNSPQEARPELAAAASHNLVKIVRMQHAAWRGNGVAGGKLDSSTL
jgi:hypothetical protein